MDSTKKAIATVGGAAVAGFILGIIIHKVFGLEEMIANAGLGSLLGNTAGSFGMRLCLLGVVGTLFFVPGIRKEFSGSYSAGSDYKSSNKGSKRRI